MLEQPYLSIVTTSRNDSHGGNMLKRMTLFVNGLITQTNRHQLPVELLIVEWNPPADLPLLHHVLPKPDGKDVLSLRYVVVPSSIHQRYKRAQEIPLFQMIAKNVGIRRAKGKFVLCTNMDLLFSDELFKILASKNLRCDTYYRANRCDVPDAIDSDWDLKRQLDWCNKNTIRRIGRNMRFKNMNLELLGVKKVPYFGKWMLNKAAWVLNLFWPEERKQFYQADCFACGDFTLMTKKAWLDIQGYLELDLHAVHVDTLGILAALALRYRQHVLPPKACTYHIDHPEGWESLTPLEKVRFLGEKPGFDYGVVYELGQYILKHRRTYNLNPETWGFSDLTFEEHTFPGAYSTPS